MENNKDETEKKLPKIQHSPDKFKLPTIMRQSQRPTAETHLLRPTAKHAEPVSTTPVAPFRTSLDVGPHVASSFDPYSKVKPAETNTPSTNAAVSGSKPTPKDQEKKKDSQADETEKTQEQAGTAPVKDSSPEATATEKGMPSLESKLQGEPQSTKVAATAKQETGEAISPDKKRPAEISPKGPRRKKRTAAKSVLTGEIMRKIPAEKAKKMASSKATRKKLTTKTNAKSSSKKTAKKAASTKSPKAPSPFRVKRTEEPPDETPTEKLEGGWPPGWTRKTFKRLSGATAGGSDRYWYSPKTKKKFRSMKEVKRFLELLPQYNGDEILAWNALKKK